MGCATAKVNSQEPPKPVISSIVIEENSLIISADQPFVYTMYKPGDPYRIIVDIPDISVGAFNKKIVSHKRGVTEVIPSQVESPSLIARLEVLLDTPSAVDQEYKNNVLTIRIKDDLSLKQDPPKQQDPPKELKIPDSDKKEKTAITRKVNSNLNPAPTPQLQLAKATEITNISFDTSAGMVKIIIQGNGSMTPNVFPLENRLVIDIADVVLNTSIPVGVISPIRGIRSGNHDGKTRLVIDLKEMTKFDVAAIGDSIVVSVKREKEPAVFASTSPIMQGKAEGMVESMPGIKEPETPAKNKCQSYLDGQENINFDFQDQDIVPIFRLFADISGCNLFIHPDVKGKATMKFIDVPWSQALETILSTFSLGKSLEGNIIKIAPHSVFTKESEDRAKAQEALAKAEPLETKIFSVSYAKVKDVDVAIKNAKLLTPRGSTSVDERTSTVLVQDIVDVFPKIEHLLTTLDKPTPQVLVEARIVEVNTASIRELGIQWGINIYASDTLSQFGGLSNLGTGPVTGGNYLVDFPSAASAGSGSGFTFGLLSPDKTFGLDLQLSAIESIGEGKIISNPKILTVDNGKAKILQGSSVPVRKLTAEGTVSTEYKDVVLELNVTPHITPDKSINMFVELKKEDINETREAVDGALSTFKKEVNTSIVIRDGETIVIGGMYKKSTGDRNSGVPGLMHIPVLGWLFKRETTAERTSELLMFVTPRIIEKP
jgi:type IV pilus assembly protein PilQ